MTSWAAVLADTTQASAVESLAETIDVTQLLQYGLLGLVVLCILFRKYLVPEWTLKAVEERAASERSDLERRLAASEEQLNKLQDVFQEQMIPALTRATEINARYNEELQRARYNRRGERPADLTD